MQGDFRPAPLVRSELHELTPYKPLTCPDVIKLDANENPFDFPAQIKQVIFEMLGDQSFTRYPDALANDLVKELAEQHGIPDDYIMVGNGSDELILDLMLTYGVNNRVAIAVPTFSMYGIHARVAGAKIIEVPRLVNFELDLDKLIQVGQEAALMMLCSPNNPSGNTATSEQIKVILENCPCLVVVDQAYVEFGGEDFTDLLASFPNLVILRTFSKAYGLAGLRVGYLFARPPVMHYLLKVKQPFNLNTFSQLAALAVLQNRETFARQVAEITAQREKMYHQMLKMQGIHVYPSCANYLMFRTDNPAAEVFSGLLDKKVLVRNFGEPQLSGFLRVSVGQPVENQIFLQSLQQVIASLGEKR